MEDFGTMRIWLAMATVLSVATAQSITASNATSALFGDALPLSISVGNAMAPLADVLPFQAEAVTELPPPGLSGIAVLANYSNSLNFDPNNIAIISCDDSDYPGNIGADDVFSSAEQANVTAILLYSQVAAACNLEDYTGGYHWIYTMESQDDSEKMLNRFNMLSSENPEPVYLTIGADVTTPATNGSSSNGNGDDGSDSSSESGQTPLGPNPSTAVAMIILYSITGVITALFLIIIITGAVRAHRHPERYGPRNIIGRARQSRARGLARAMLETIPIVKFGEREEPKPTDVELGDATVQQDTARDATQNEAGAQPGNTVVSGAVDSETSGREATGTTADPEHATAGGIAAASQNREAPSTEDVQGCSICTEDFQIGEDQRVLPCDHRFHPACVDPWLLNVSGTCPLCRIDLRPAETNTSAEPELDEHGNPIEREGEEGAIAPPLGGSGTDARRSVRRSILYGLTGIHRPDRMSREERVAALRRYRAQLAERRQQQEQDGTAAPEVATEESGLRGRLRNAFRIRTRRTGGDEVPAAGDADESRREGTLSGAAGR